jgi:hypothetical protein
MFSHNAHTPEHCHCSLCARSPKGKYCEGGAYDVENGVILAPLSAACPQNMTTVGRRSVSVRACGECGLSAKRSSSSSRMLTTLCQPQQQTMHVCQFAHKHTHFSSSAGSSTSNTCPTQRSLNPRLVSAPAKLVPAALQSRTLDFPTASTPRARNPRPPCARPTHTVLASRSRGPACLAPQASSLTPLSPTGCAPAPRSAVSCSAAPTATRPAAFPRACLFLASPALSLSAVASTEPAGACVCVFDPILLSTAVVPAGYYLKAPGQVAACPQGEYKEGLATGANCTKCAFGVTTAGEGSTSRWNCTSESAAAAAAVASTACCCCLSCAAVLAFWVQFLVRVNAVGAEHCSCTAAPVACFPLQNCCPATMLLR